MCPQSDERKHLVRQVHKIKDAFKNDDFKQPLFVTVKNPNVRGMGLHGLFLWNSKPVLDRGVGVEQDGVD